MCLARARGSGATLRNPRHRLRSHSLDVFGESQIDASIEPVNAIDPIEYPEHDVNLTDVIMTYGEFNFAEELQKLINLSSDFKASKADWEEYSDIVEDLNYKNSGNWDCKLW